MAGQLTVKPNPFNFDGHDTVVAPFLPKETLGEYVQRNGIKLPRSEFQVWHNGHIVPIHLWDRLIPRTGDSIVIAGTAHGGGGGGKILRTVAMVALVIAAPHMAVGMGFTAGSVGASLATAGIMIGGSMLINALLPPPKPAMAQLGKGNKHEVSPTYSLTGGRNSMRPWEPMTVIFGQHKVIPDLGANYFTEWVGNTQYLNQLFHFGLHDSDLELGGFRIGATPLEEYKDVQLEISKPNGHISLFPGNVESLDGFVLESGVRNTRRTGEGVTSISVELAAQLYRVDDQGKFQNETVELRVQYRPASGGSWQDIGEIVDPIYATHYWSLRRTPPSDLDIFNSPLVPAHSEQVAYGSTDPNEHAEGEEGVISPGHSIGPILVIPPVMGTWHWVPHPHASGKPWRGVAPDPLIGHSTTPGVRMTGKKQEPTRRTVSFSVPKGQYEVRVWKTTGDRKESRRSNEVAVNQILAFREDTAAYTGQKRVGLRIKATSQLSGSVDQLSAIAAARAPVWVNGEWKFQLTRNPAWSFLKFALGKEIDGVLAYGAGLSLEQLDLDSIKEWATWCDANNLKFDWVLDRQMSVFDVLSLIARAGRASPTWKKGKLGVIWDAANLPAVAMFGPFNIKAGSFEVSYLNSSGIADEIIVSFPNEARDWQADEVRVQVPGTSGHKNPLTLDLEGVTSVGQAGREANLIAASQVWHRRRITFETDIEGWVASRGDVVQFSHDLTVWGYSGRLLGRDGDELMLSTDLPDGNGIMMLRDPEGNMLTVSVTASDEPNKVVVVSDTEGFALPGDDGFENIQPMDWAWFFDPEETPGRRFKIVDVQPVGMEGIRFEAVDDDPGYYASEHDPYQHTPPRDGALLAGKVYNLRASEGYVNTIAGTVPVTFSWNLSVPALVDVEVLINGRARPTERGMMDSIVVTAKADDVIVVTVTPITITRASNAESLEYTVVAEPSEPTQVGASSAEIEDTMLRLHWPANPEPDIVGYEVRANDSGWGNNNYLFRGDASTCAVEPGLPEEVKTWYIRAYNGARIYSEVSQAVSFTLDEIPNVSAIEEKFQDTSLTNATITLKWEGVEPQLGLEGYVVSYDDEREFTDSTTITLSADWIGNKTYQVCAMDKRGNVSSGTQKSIQKLLPNPPTDIRAQVIDNNVLLYWTLPQRTTLPIDHVLVKEGETWAAGREVGTKKGSFTSLSELTPGQKRYWMATVDTDGWESDPVSIGAHVSEPPDFIFRGEIQSDLGGTLTNGVRRSEGVLLPVNTTETWQQHFGSRSWGSPQDQVDDGYPVYIQPTPTPGIYVEEFDFGTVVPSSRVYVAMVGVVVAGNPTIEQTIQTSQDGVTWSSPTNGTNVFATNFRYVRYTLRVIQADDRAIYRLNGVVVTLSTKLKNDGGNTACLASDPSGTIANFNMTFIDVSSITLTPAGTSPKTAVYDFKDAVLSGTYSIVSGVATVNVSGHGLLPGQDVMLLYANREPQRATVQTATANSFVALVDGPNKSGNLQIYSQSMRIYLFDANGNRASGSVSWAIKGN